MNLVAFFISLFSIVPVTAFASISVQTLRPTNNFFYVMVEDSLNLQYLPNPNRYVGGYFFGLQYNTMSSPLSMYEADGSYRKDIVDRISTVDFSLKKAITRRFGLAADISLNEVKIDNKNKFGAGDLRIQPEYQIYDKFKKFMGLSLLGELYLPTGSTSDFLSTGNIGFGSKLVLEKNISKLSVALNLGYLYFKDATYRNLDYSEQLYASWGIYLPVGKKFALNLESPSLFLTQEKSTRYVGELYLGGQYASSYTSKFMLGASYSETENDKKADIRVLLSYKFMPFLNEPVKKDPPPERIIERIERIERVEVQKVEIHNSINQCEPKKFQQKFQAQTLSAEEFSQLSQLPYKSTPDYRVTNLNLGEMSGLVNGVPYATNAQILFAVDLEQMPDPDAVLAMESANLMLDIRRLAKTPYGDTEILCILNERLCSGELLGEEKGNRSINNNFFDGKETPNDHFSKQYIDRTVATLGDRKIYAGDLVISLKNIIENSLVRDIKNIFYKNNVKNKKLYFLIANDTFVSKDAHLEITMMVDSCKIKEFKKNKKKTLTSGKKNETVL